MKNEAIMALALILAVLVFPAQPLAVAEAGSSGTVFIDPRIPETGIVDVLVVLDSDTWLAIRAAESVDEAVNILKAWAAESQKPIVEAIDDMGGEVLNRFWIVNALLVRIDAGLMGDIAVLPGVEAILLNAPDARIIDPVEPVAVVQAPLIENWGVYAVNATGAWSMGYTGSGVRIAVIDTGVYIDHVTLQGKLLTLDPTDILYPGGWISIDSNGNLQCTRPRDPNGHGTFVASLALGGSPGVYNIGVAPDAKLMAVQAFNADGTATGAQLLKAFEWTVNPTTCQGNPTGIRPHIVSLSAGINGYAGTLLLDAIRTLLETGVIVVAATGNSGPGSVSYPGNVWGVYGIGAVDNTSTVASSSSGGLVTWPDPPVAWPFKPPYPSSYTKPDFVAPGVNVIGAGNGGTTLFYIGNGTSFSTPHVSGAVALILQAMGALNYTSPVDGRILAELVYDIMVNTSMDLGPTGLDDRYGYGLIDVGSAVVLAEELAKVYTLNVTVTPGEATVGDNVTVTAAASGFTVPDGTPFSLLLDGTPLPVSPVWNGSLQATFTLPEKPRGNYTIQIVSIDARYQGQATLIVKPSIKAPTTVRPGTSIAVTLYAHDPASNYTILFDGTPIATAQTNSNGTASTAIPIPAGAQPGIHTLETRDATTGDTLASTILQVAEQAQTLGGSLLALQASGPTLVETGATVEVYLAVFTPSGPANATINATVTTPTGTVTPAIQQVAPGLYKATYQAQNPGYYVLYANAWTTIDNTTLYTAAIHVAYATSTLQNIQDTVTGIKQDTTTIITKLDNTTRLLQEATSKLDAISNRLTTIQEALYSLEENLTTAILKAQGQITTQIQQAANTTQTAIQGSTASILETLDQAVNAVNATMTGLAVEVTGNLTTINSKLDNTLTRLSTLEEAVAGIQGSLNQALQQLTAVQDSLTRLGQTLEDKTKQLEEAIISLAEAIQEQGQSINQISSTLNEITAKIQEAINLIAQLTDKTNTLDEKTTSMNEALTTVAGEVQALKKDVAQANDTASQAKTAGLAAAALALGALAAGAIRLFK